MIFDNIEVQDPDGNTRKAKLAKCDCGSEAFTVFQIVGQNHLHLQCIFCDTSYCPNEQCKGEVRDVD